MFFLCRLLAKGVGGVVLFGREVDVFGVFIVTFIGAFEVLGIVVATLVWTIVFLFIGIWVLFSVFLQLFINRFSDKREI